MGRSSILTATMTATAPMSGTEATAIVLAKANEFKLTTKEQQAVDVVSQQQLQIDEAIGVYKVDDMEDILTIAHNDTHQDSHKNLTQYALSTQMNIKKVFKKLESDGLIRKGNNGYSNVIDYEAIYKKFNDGGYIPYKDFPLTNGNQIPKDKSLTINVMSDSPYLRDLYNYLSPLMGKHEVKSRPMHLSESTKIDSKNRKSYLEKVSK